jgi:hypothetical protein
MPELKVDDTLFWLYDGNPLAAIDTYHVVKKVAACICHDIECILPHPLRLKTAYIKGRPKGKALRWRKHYILSNGTSTFYIINTDIDYHDAYVDAIDLSPGYNLKSKAEGYVHKVTGPHFPKGAEGYFELTTISEEKMKMSEYMEAEDKSMGWCTRCKDFTRFQTEPDARGYDCPECGHNTVLGTMEALMNGEFEIEEE